MASVEFFGPLSLSPSHGASRAAADAAAASMRAWAARMWASSRASSSSIGEEEKCEGNKKLALTNKKTRSGRSRFARPLPRPCGALAPKKNGIAQDVCVCVCVEK